jgi:putative ABC transport system permease protein
VYLRHSMRILIRKRAFSLSVITILALGIGLNTTLFNLANGILFKKLPLRDVERLVVLNWYAERVPENLVLTGSSNPHEPGTGRVLNNVFSSAAFEAVRGRSHTLEDVVAFAPLGPLVAGWQGTGHSGLGLVVSGNYFADLGVHAAVGRLLMAEDDRPEARPAAVVSYQFWQSALGGNPGVVGNTITVDNVAFTLVGVTAREFRGVQAIGLVSSPDVTVTMAQLPLIQTALLGGTLPPMRQPGHWGLQMMARLRPGVTKASAREEANYLFQQTLEPEWSGIARQPEMVMLTGQRGPATLAALAATPLLVLQLLTGMVFLVVCANVANLFWVHITARRGEFAIRLSLGARRRDLFSGLLMECLLLAGSAAVLGVAMSWAASALLLAKLPRIPLVSLGVDARPDLHVIGFALAAALAAAVLVAYIPALHIARTEPAAALRGGQASNWTKNDGHLGWTNRGLIVAQLAITLPLLAICGVFLFTLMHVRNAPLGFVADNVTVFHVDPSLQGYTGEHGQVFYQSLLDELRREPGVVAVTGSVNAVAGDMSFGRATMAIEVNQENAAEAKRKGDEARVNDVMPDFFRTMGITRLKGREFSRQDDAKAPLVGILSASAERRYFAGMPAVGRSFRAQGSKVWILVVGVVADVKDSSFSDSMEPAVYLPYMQDGGAMGMYVELRTAGRVENLTHAIHAAVERLAPGVAIEGLQTQAEMIDNSLALSSERLLALLTGAFSALALLLASVGLYGTTAYMAGLRAREIAIRVALGGGRRRILWELLRQTVVVVGVGLSIGLALAWMVARSICSALGNTESHLVATLGIAGPVLLAVALAAVWVPANRVVSRNPMSALKYE